jgi:hypothetical protein
MKYQFIEQHKQDFPVVVMCRVVAVSESGYYAWRKRLCAGYLGYPFQKSQFRCYGARFLLDIILVFENGYPKVASIGADMFIRLWFA